MSCATGEYRCSPAGIEEEPVRRGGGSAMHGLLMGPGMVGARRRCAVEATHHPGGTQWNEMLETTGG